ncbi:hypothetical protein [Nocardia sp. NPDC050793]
MFDRAGRVRQPYEGILAAPAPIDVADLARRSDALARAFPLDPVPR